MVDPIAFRRTMFRGLFLLVCAVLIFSKLLPLGTEPIAIAVLDPITGELAPTQGKTLFIPGPDLIFGVMAAWILRRPRWAPVGLVFVVFLLTDILFLKPVGLWAAIGLLSMEFLRNRVQGTTEMPWPTEVVLVGSVFAVATLTNALVFLIFGLPLPSISTLILHIIMTAAAYPVVLLVTHYVLRVRRAKPTDMDAAEAG